MAPPKIPIEKRFFDHIETIPECGCWLWTAHTDKDGYGDVKIGCHTVRAHRVSWELHNGKIPEGMWVLHSCDTPSCVNPRHLFLGTHKDNMADAKTKNRLYIGEKNGRAKLTEQEVVDIFNDTRKRRHVLDEYKISKASYYRIKNKIAWGHLWK